MSKRILLVDDDQDILDIAEIAFQKFAQWQVFRASSGLECLEKATTEELDVILLDVSMPDMDGFQVVEILQADPPTQKIPIVLLTARALPRDEQYYREIGIAGVLMKPFNPLTIWRELSEILVLREHGTGSH
ncbi:response regulator [Crocosphaera chwakensis]|uniref:Response regulator receiver domain protein (CheY) n=1 Tax=Crocosphaera chwakensis CCY0110 TaxID=391612 RepID=A3IKK5_9CHRO|nr:response regulator [Crocosphaera chwakensis]EAZ93194.1 Response regulator receiver domain protein (CheY) [Crocosphaera chwakensis CCY0110]